MRVLIFILILAVIVLVSNASPPKKRATRTGVGLKRPLKSKTARPNSAASRAFTGPTTLRKSANSKQFNKPAKVNNRRSLQKGIGSGSSNNGRVRRAAAATSRDGSKRSKAKPGSSKKRGFGQRNGNRSVNLPFVKIPEDIPVDDEQSLDELPDNDAAFDMSKYGKSLGNSGSGRKTSSGRTLGAINDKFLDDASFGNITENGDLGDISTKSNVTIDELLKHLNLDDDEENIEGINGDVGDTKGPESPVDNAELNLSKEEKNSSLLSDAELDELLKDNVVEPNISEDAQIAEPIDVGKPLVESETDKSRLEPNLENNDKEVDRNIDELAANEGSEKAENPSVESSGQPASVVATGKSSDDKVYDYEDLDDEELPEDHYKETKAEDDNKKV